MRARLDSLTKLYEYGDFRELDWQSLATELERLKDEKRRLESASDLLKTLMERLENLMREMGETESQLQERRDQSSKTEQKRSDAQSLREQTRPWSWIPPTLFTHSVSPGWSRSGPLRWASTR